MQIFTTLDPPIPIKESIVLSIGNFDGIHLGHQAVLSRLEAKKTELHMKSALITFVNHPVEVLQAKTVSKICTLNHKIKLFEQFHLDYLFVLTFTQAFSQLSSFEFLKLLKDRIPLCSLLLGHDSTLGRDREGNREVVEKLTQEMGVGCEYVDPLLVNDMRVSSSLIKQLIQTGDLEALKTYLGRPYSIVGNVESGKGKGKVLGYPTANLSVEGLCLPPLGVYAVKVLCGDERLTGIANLGKAPTIRQDDSPILETFLFDHSTDLYGKQVEVIFEGFIRPEKKFPSVSALQEQISHDIEAAKILLSSQCKAAQEPHQQSALQG